MIRQPSLSFLVLLLCCGIAAQARGHFEGLLGEVKVYNRALGLREVIAEYNRGAGRRGHAPRDTSWFDRFRLKPYLYPRRKRLVVEVDYRGLLPIAEGSEMFVELSGPGRDVRLARRTIEPRPHPPLAEVAFPLDGLAPGRYEISAVLKRGGARGGPEVRETLALAHPAPERKLPAPAQRVVPSLPSPRPKVRYQLALGPGGGFVVTVNGRPYPVESSYSFPHGGQNRLLAKGPPDARGDRAWRVETRSIDAAHCEVAASGRHYAVDRRITLEPHRILVSDKITNRTRDVLGIVLDNHVCTGGAPDVSVDMRNNYTLFVSGEDHGLGIVALDDVYQLQQQTRYRDHAAAMVTDKLGLAGGASYTVQWAVYATASGDYLEFINALRRDEGLNRTVQGAFRLVGDGEGLVTAENRRKPVRPEEVRAKGLKYVSYFYLIAPADDPGMSLEGIEFTEYPKESALLKQTIAETHRLNPGLKVMFHVAHGLYATNRPERLFPDSRVIKEDGRQLLYGSDSADYYCRYFSRERFDQGHRWWIFYPTMENSFGRAMLKAVDTMLEEIGTSGMYADGFASGYARGYTCDTWDGHSVEIDPKTQTVSRKLGNVTLMALPVLKAVTRKIAAKGGIVITNGGPGPRSLWKESYFTTCETTGGDRMPISRLYVGPTVTAFGDPARIGSRRDLYLDVLAKLRYGALYFYYGDRHYGLKEQTIVPHMYPFTLQELHDGWMQGKERIIARVSGVYGWPGDRQLHRVHRSDARGMLVPNEDFSTADAEGVRTQLVLGELESAVVERLPAVLQTEQPVNFLVTRYGPGGIALRLHGEIPARLTLRDGEFPIVPGRKYLITSDKTATIQVDAAGALTVPLALRGETRVRISRPLQ